MKQQGFADAGFIGDFLHGRVPVVIVGENPESSGQNILLFLLWQLKNFSFMILSSFSGNPGRFRLGHCRGVDRIGEDSFWSILKGKAAEIGPSGKETLQSKTKSGSPFETPADRQQYKSEKTSRIARE